MLIDFGARANARDTNGRNALHLACEFGFRKTSVTLMENKCDREANDKYSMRPVEYALDKGHDGLVDIMESVINLNLVLAFLWFQVFW